MSENDIENPWGDRPTTIPPAVPPTVPVALPVTTAHGAQPENRRRIRLAAGGVATLVAVGGVAYAQTTHASTATAATTGTSSGSGASTSSSSSSRSSGVGVSAGSGSAQATSAGS